MSYGNLGPGAASEVVLQEVVPEHTTFSAGQSSSGWVCVPDNTAGSACTLGLGSVASDAVGEAVFAVVANWLTPHHVTEIDNTASIADDGANGPDPDPLNNVSSETTPLGCEGICQ